MARKIITLKEPSVDTQASSPATGTSERVAKVSSANSRNTVSGGVRGMVQSAFAWIAGARTHFQAATLSPKFKVPTDVGPNGANGEIPILRARSRYAKANYGWYRQAMRQLANNVVGYGITPIIKYPDLKKLYKLWGAEADARGKFSINGLQWFLMEMVATDGEGIARWRERRVEDMVSGIPFQIQLMPPDHLPIGMMVAPGGAWVTDGIERDAIDRPLRYWLHPMNPLDWKSKVKSNGVNDPVPVRAEDIAHVFWPESVESERGSPWGASVLNALEFLRDYQMSEVEKKALQSKFTVVYSQPAGASDEGEAYAGEEADTPEKNFSAIPGGAAVVSPEGYEPKLVEMPQNDANYEGFNRFSLSEVGVAIGLCVEQITLDFSKVNDRVYRAMMLEIGRFVYSIQFHLMVDQFLNPMYKRFVSTAVKVGKWSPPPGAKPEDYMQVEWMPPARGHIHPIQEVQAFMMAVQAGFTSREKVAAEFGFDIDEIDMENAGGSQRAQIEGLAYTVYDGWRDQPITPQMLEIRKQQAQAVIDAIQKMAEEDMDKIAA